MKREINLITPEYMEASTISWTRIAGMVLAVLLIFAFISAFLLVPYHLSSLDDEKEELEEEYFRLNRELEDVRDMKARVDKIKQKEYTVETIAGMKYPFSSNFEEMMDTSGGEINVFTVSVGKDRDTVIRGTGTTLENIAEYILALEELEFLTGVTHSYMELEDADIFAFEARGLMIQHD